MKQLADLIQKSDCEACLKKFSGPKFLEVTKLINSALKKQQAMGEQRSHPRADNSCDKSTRGGSSSKHGITTPSQFNSAGKQVLTNKSILHQNQMTTTGGAVSSADSKK